MNPVAASSLLLTVSPAQPPLQPVVGEIQTETIKRRISSFILKTVGKNTTEVKSLKENSAACSKPTESTPTNTKPSTAARLTSNKKSGLMLSSISSDIAFRSEENSNSHNNCIGSHLIPKASSNQPESGIFPTPFSSEIIPISNLSLEIALPPVPSAVTERLFDDNGKLKDHGNSTSITLPTKMTVLADLPMDQSLRSDRSLLPSDESSPAEKSVPIVMSSASYESHIQNPRAVSETRAMTEVLPIIVREVDYSSEIYSKI